MKGKRQEELLDIIASSEYETQDQLLEQLSLRGIETTQATISRDIKQLHISKVMSDKGTYHYAVVDEKEVQSASERLRGIFRQCVISYDYAQNIVVINTMPGLASGAAAALDDMNQPGMVGSLAGDDTAILIMRTTEDAERFCRDIRGILQ